MTIQTGDTSPDLQPQTNLSTETASTIGAQRAQNHALRRMPRERFELVTSDLPDAPPYFTYDAILNSRERPTLEQVLERALRPLDLEQVLALAARGAQLLDTRDPAQYAEGHLRGSVNVRLDGAYETWCGTVLDPRQPLVVIAGSGREVQAVKRLGGIGFDAVAGYLAGGIDQAPDDLPAHDRAERIGADALAGWVTRADPPLVIDVRNQSEWDQGRIEQAMHVPPSRLTNRLGTLPTDRPIVVYCASGYRSSIAASVLRREGFLRVVELADGLAAQPMLVNEVRPSSARTADSDQAVPVGQFDGRRA